MLASIQPYLLDVFLGLFLIYFTVLGYRRGLVQTVGQLLGAVAGFWIAKRWALPLSHTVQLFVPLSAELVQVVVFILIFFVADRVVSFLFWIVDKFFKIVTLLPFLSTVYAILGAVVGFFDGIFLIGSLSYVILALHLNPAWMVWIAASRIGTVSQMLFYRVLGVLT